jgi:hypothetical protein
MESGVHFATGGCVSAYVTALWWIVLQAQRGERRADAQTRNMDEQMARFGLRTAARAQVGP